MLRWGLRHRIHRHCKIPREASPQVSRIVIVGGGHAAGQAAASLRQEKFDGEITIVGEEPHPPYQRPPLSKQYLAGEQPLERVYLRPEKFYAERNIELRTGVRVEAIDRAARTVTTAAGDTIPYDTLILATGTRARTLALPGSDLAGIHYLRTIADVDAIAADLESANSVVIVGGGYIGLEVASVARDQGKAVTVLEMEKRILQRVTTEEMSAYYHRVHSERGVVIRVNTRASGFEGRAGRVTAVLSGDERMPADLVIIGVGVIPNTELAEAAGLACDNGILVDEYCRTGDPDIWAIGDCTNHPSALTGGRLRLESVPNAMEQARVVAANIAGKARRYDAVPWFWSDQYDLKLQMVGFSTDADHSVTRGDPEANTFITFHVKDGRVIAADAVNDARNFMVAKQLVAGRSAVSDDQLRDPGVNLKGLV